jgi:hypothetical protein
MNTLERILDILIHADREISSATPMYKIKALFDDIIFDNYLEYDSEHGQLIKLALDSKRRDDLSKNIIRARHSLTSSLERYYIKNQELEEIQKSQDLLSIDSICTTVSVTSEFNNNEIQLKLNDTPTPLGRPRLINALSGAQRAKKARDKKKSNNVVTVNCSLNQEASAIYTQMIEDGHDLNSIVFMANNQASLHKH